MHEYGARRAVPLTVAVRALVETEEIKPKPRAVLRDLLNDFARWSPLVEPKRITNWPNKFSMNPAIPILAKGQTAEAAGRLENLKELVRSMEEFPDLPLSSNMFRW